MGHLVYKRTQLEWDQFHMGVAAKVAGLSKDPDRRVGAVLVSPDRRQLSIGYNGFPPGVLDSEEHLHDREFKLANMVHAEANCLAQAPFNPRGSTLFVTRAPCCQCARRIVEAGVVRVVSPRPDFGHLRWGDSWIRAEAMLREAHVAVAHMDLEGL